MGRGHTTHRVFLFRARVQQVQLQVQQGRPRADDERGYLRHFLWHFHRATSTGVLSRGNQRQYQGIAGWDEDGVHNESTWPCLRSFLSGVQVLAVESNQVREGCVVRTT